MDAKKIIFFTKYDQTGPSSRYRIFQYLNKYEERNYDFKINILLGDWYFKEPLSFKIVIRIILSYFRRIFIIFSVRKYDIVYIEYELFPFFPALAEQILSSLKIKYIVDYDDAIFHNYNLSKRSVVKLFLSNKIDIVIQNAAYVIAGSPYLTEYISKFNSNFIEIPTSLNSDVYKNDINKDQTADFTVGWIGSKSTSVNLLNLIPVFGALNSRIHFQINLIGFDENFKSHFKGLNVNFIKWSSASEISEIAKFDVGIMPLDITPFNKGKCGFKLIQYMACGKPTISTPLEANLKINRNGKNLFASTTDEWIHTILEVYNNQKKFKKVGSENYNIFKQFYCIDSNYPQYIKIFANVIENNF